MVGVLREMLDFLDMGNRGEARRRAPLALEQVYELTGDEDGALKTYRRATEMQTVWGDRNTPTEIGAVRNR